MKHRWWLFLIFIYYWANPTFAQILKVDKGFLATDSSNYFAGVIDATFAINNRGSTADRQNTYIGMNNHVDVMYVGDQSATILISGLNYFKIGTGPLIYNGTAHLRHVLYRSARVTPEFFTQGQFDESRNMTSQWLLGGGLRWNILQKKNSLFAGVGIFNENELWKGAEESITKRLWKMNSYMSADIRLSPSTNINTIVYFQTGRDAAIDEFRHRLSGQFEFKNALTRRFKIKLTSNFLLDDKPIIPLSRFIYEVYFGGEYSFN